MATRTGTNKVLLKLKKSVEAGDYYEAHQIHVKAKQYERAIELLSSGATLLLEHKQYSSGVDLSHYLLDVYQQTSTPVNKDTLGLIVALIGKVPSTVKARKQLIATAIQWTAKHGYAPNGHMELHDYVGRLYRQEGNYAEAEKHFFLGSDCSAAAWGDMLYEGSMGASDITRGNYIARPVLQYLCEKNLSGAQAALAAFMARLKAEDAAAYVVGTKAFGAPSIDPPEDVFDDDADLPATTTTAADDDDDGSTATMTIDIFRPPLVNFCQALVLLVQRDARDLFTMLRNRYRAELREEKVFDEMLDNIGHIYFNIPLPASGNQQMNMMQQMLQGILAGNMGARS